MKKLIREVFGELSEETKLTHLPKGEVHIVIPERYINRSNGIIDTDAFMFDQIENSSPYDDLIIEYEI